MREKLVKHLLGVGYISYSFGNYLKLSETELIDLLYGGIYHDIGKFSLEDELLFKKGKLTDLEKETTMLHPVIGYNKLKRTNISTNILNICIQHHERDDGNGYPYGLKGNEISKLAKIVSLVDSYDAMTTDRVYQKGKTHEKAIEEIFDNLGSQFDTVLGKEFIKFLSKYDKKEDLWDLLP